jgi:hypothetical protein
VKAGIAVYVGVATMGLRKRLYFYAKPGATQRTSRRLNAILIEDLTRGASIAIYTVCPPDMDWNGLTASGTACLELGLIEGVRQHWQRVVHCFWNARRHPNRLCSGVTAIPICQQDRQLQINSSQQIQHSRPTRQNVYPTVYPHYRDRQVSIA